MTNPQALSTKEVKILMSHPIIKSLVERSRDPQQRNVDYFVPMDNMINPHKPETVNILVRPTSNSDDEMSTESNDSNEEERLGHYSKAERAQRIKHYKAKL
jgi:hypothetical protein